MFADLNLRFKIDESNVTVIAVEQLTKYKSYNLGIYGYAGADKICKFSFSIDVTWCLEQLQKDGRITERDKLFIQTTHRQKDQLKWHPLQWIASLI